MQENDYEKDSEDDHKFNKDREEQDFTMLDKSMEDFEKDDWGWIY